MLKYKNEILDTLKDGYDYIIVPKHVMDLPIEFRTMELVDEDGNTTGYASINELSKQLGDLFSPVELANDYCGYRWCYNIGMRHESVEVFEAYLKAKGLVDIQDKTTGEFNFDIKNGFAMCDIRTFRKLPKQKQEEI